MVRPGITGWAQVNGGTLLSPEEKEALDAWYIAHASLWLDLRIMAMTVRSLFLGDRRSEQALTVARGELDQRIKTWLICRSAPIPRTSRRRPPPPVIEDCR